MLPPGPHPVRYTSVSGAPVTPIVPTLTTRAGSLMQAAVISRSRKRCSESEEDTQACWHKCNQHSPQKKDGCGFFNICSNIRHGIDLQGPDYDLQGFSFKPVIPPPDCTDALGLSFSWGISVCP